MDSKLPPDILQADFSSRDVSLSLQLMLERNGIGRIKDLLNHPMEDWFNFAGFSQHHLNELMNLLETDGLAGYISD